MLFIILTTATNFLYPYITPYTTPIITSLISYYTIKYTTNTILSKIKNYCWYIITCSFRN